MAVSLTTLTDLSHDLLDALVVSMGQPVFRANQIRIWVYQKLAGSYDEMTDLPLFFRQRLIHETRLSNLVAEQVSASLDETKKVLFKGLDGNTVEAALMYYGGDGKKERRTVCVSTQAGCAIGCPFCATGRMGLQRNLSTGEIVDQVLYFARLLKNESARRDDTEQAEQISNVVFMGMGEPLANYDNLWRAIQTLNDPDGFKLGARNMTISTAGFVPGIKRLSLEKIQVGLAVSLHAANNLLRTRLVPLNKQYPLEVLLPACRQYSEITGRRISFEYTLFKGINDSRAHARELVELLQGFSCHVNLIPANQTGDNDYSPPQKNVVLAFEDELKKHHINVTLRESRGQDINAGCGQLRSRYLGSTGKISKE